MRKRILALVFGFLICGAFGLGGEFVVRELSPPGDFVLLSQEPLFGYRPERYIDDPCLAGKHVFYVNGQGQRDVPGRVIDAPRLALAGASNLSGFRLGWTEALPGQLEQALGEPVLDLAVIGYDSTQVAAQLAQAGLDGIEVLVVSAGINDVTHWPESPRASRFAHWMWRTGVHSTLFDQLAYLPWVHHARQVCPEYRPRVPLGAFLANVETIAAICRDRGIVPVFMPDPIPFHDEIESSRAVRCFVEGYFERHPEILRVENEARKYDLSYQLACKAGLDDLFPSADPERFLWLTRYEPVLLAQADGFDLNAVLESERQTHGLTTEEIFQPGYVTPDGRIAPDYCHLNSRGWRLVVDALADHIRNLRT